MKFIIIKMYNIFFKDFNQFIIIKYKKNIKEKFFDLKKI